MFVLKKKLFHTQSLILISGKIKSDVYYFNFYLKPSSLESVFGKPISLKLILRKTDITEENNRSWEIINKPDIFFDIEEKASLADNDI